MLNKAEVEQFRTRGFLLGKKVLSDEQVEVLRKETLRVIDQRNDASVKQPVLCRNLTGKEESPVWQIVNIWEASEPFKQLVRNPVINEEIAQLLDARQVRLWHDQIQYKPAARGGVNMWHQDSPLWPSLRPKNEQVSAWIALDDVDTANGCMSMVPSSHLWGNQIEFLRTIMEFDKTPAEFEGKPVERILCPVKKGHVHYHHSLTWHGSHANTSERPRRAIALHYMNERTLFDATGNHPMKAFVTVADGQMLQGDSFPLVWESR